MLVCGASLSWLYRAGPGQEVGSRVQAGSKRTEVCMPAPDWKHFGMGGCQGQCSLNLDVMVLPLPLGSRGGRILLPICPRASTFMVWRTEVTLFLPSLLTQQSLHCLPIASEAVMGAYVLLGPTLKCTTAFHGSQAQCHRGPLVFLPIPYKTQIPHPGRHV